jgi:cation diffusion facilitator CzcD-associated flavoprotein CzcO
MSLVRKVCIIGAGSSGIAAAKAMKDRDIPFDCFEMSDRVGGNWVLRNRNGLSSAYRSLHIPSLVRTSHITPMVLPRRPKY